MINTEKQKEKLETELNRVVDELKTLGTYTPTTDDWTETLKNHNVPEADPNTEADASEELEEHGATLSALEIEYHNIKLSLKKIEEGRYGICEIGGEQIEEKRLEFKPDARTCIEHMNQEDKLPL